MTLIDQIKQHIAESGSSQGKVAKVPNAPVFRKPKKKIPKR